MIGQAALVTGSSRGIGLAAAIALAEAGFGVALNGRGDSDVLQRAAERLRSIGGRVAVVPFDVADIGCHAECLDQAEHELGPLTTLVNNAGVSVLRRGDPLEVTPESWDRCLAVNARASFFLSQAFARRLLARKRSPSLFHCIVNVTSSNAVAVAVPRAEYCASKAAAAMISKVFAARLGGENIAVYDVQPGLIETDMTAPVIEDYKTRTKDGLTLFPRVGQADEIGRVIASLAAGLLPYTTGQTISADGGMLVPRF